MNRIGWKGHSNNSSLSRSKSKSRNRSRSTIQSRSRSMSRSRSRSRSRRRSRSLLGHGVQGLHGLYHHDLTRPPWASLRLDFLEGG